MEQQHCPSKENTPSTPWVSVFLCREQVLMPLPPNDPFIVHEDYVGQPYQSLQMLVKKPGTSSCLPNPLQ